MKLTPEVTEFIKHISVEAEMLVFEAKAAGVTFGTAESLTAGMVGSEVASIPGVSAHYLGGAITYTDAEKVRQCGVLYETLERFTAVSDPTAIEMARGFRSRIGADFVVSTTGYAGPGGGDEANPVGTYYVAVASQGKVSATKFYCTGDRDAVRLNATRQALSLLRQAIREQNLNAASA